ncbi:MAG: response regulator [Gammaproteobacteria bacterium]|nr:response regulator [Gammaproteobacteria bacterium]
MISVMIVDDHDLVRTGLRHILSDCNDIEVVAEASSGDEALRLAREFEPQIILLDVSMPGLSGFEVADRLHRYHKKTRTVILTAHAKQPFPSRLLEAGASGYLTKSCGADELRSAIRAVHRGDRYIGSDIAQQLALSMLPGADKSPFEKLSSREMEVTLMMVQGMTINNIGEALSLSPKTVATYKYRVFEKSEVDNEVALAYLALKHGLIEDTD